MPYQFIQWDQDDDPDGNTQHCADSGLSQEEIEEVLQDPDDIDNSRSSGRPVAFGETSTGRYIMVVYEEIDGETVRPITAYDVPEVNRP